MDFYNDVHLEVRCLDRLIAEKFTGALVYPSLEEDTPRQLLKMILGGFPMVFIDRAPPEMPCWLISSDDYEIGRLAARHLIEAGSKVLACVGSPFSQSPGTDQGIPRGGERPRRRRPFQPDAQFRERPGGR